MTTSAVASISRCASDSHCSSCGALPVAAAAAAAATAPPAVGAPPVPATSAVPGLLRVPIHTRARGAVGLEAPKEGAAVEADAPPVGGDPRPAGGLRRAPLAVFTPPPGRVVGDVEAPVADRADVFGAVGEGGFQLEAPPDLSPAIRALLWV
jgi:hypothetical protein